MSVASASERTLNVALCLVVRFFGRFAKVIGGAVVSIVNDADPEPALAK